MLPGAYCQGKILLSLDETLSSAKVRLPLKLGKSQRERGVGGYADLRIIAFVYAAAFLHIGLKLVFRVLLSQRYLRADLYCLDHPLAVLQR